MLRSEINGTELARGWDPEGLVWPALAKHQQVHLSHTTVWRWFQEAGQRANKVENRYGQIRHSGIWAADSTLSKVKDKYVAVLGVADAVSRVVFQIVRIVAESEEEVLKKFARLRGIGVNTKLIRGLVSDGADAYRLLIEGVMKRTVHQRCVFHLWRNIGPSIRSLKAIKGEEAAEAFKEAVRAVWDARGYEEAKQALGVLVEQWSEEALVAPALVVIEASFEEAVAHLKGGVPGMPRTSPSRGRMVEWLWQGYKRRLRIMGQLMSNKGLASYNAVWTLHVNFNRYQKRKERKRRVNNPGQCPLEMAGEKVDELSWMDVLAI